MKFIRLAKHFANVIPFARHSANQFRIINSFWKSMIRGIFRECNSISFETFRESIPYIINSFWKSMIRGIFRECNSISFETFRESISLNISLSWNLGQHGFAEIKLMSLVAVNNQNNNDWLNDWRWNS